MWGNVDRKNSEYGHFSRSADDNFSEMSVDKARTMKYRRYDRRNSEVKLENLSLGLNNYLT